MKYIGYLLLTVLLFSCRGTKNTVKVKSEDKSTIQLTAKKEQLIEVVNDTLTGIVPIPKLSNKPIQLVFGSSGTKLNLHLTDTSAAYQVTTKVNKRTYTKEQTDTDIQKDEKLAVEVVEQKTPWRPPWWLGGVIVLLLIAIRYLIKKYKKITTIV
ncbi:hypothetical protein [Tenacibaculum mesophilum]|uniref:hypothetical protein n=1 Tax=Tenacibaculum mesophilum TaxID=104268 RepID=UPI00064AEFE8|nr:hypothetical protein [Tenacibaculum mesophilum]